MPIWQSAINPFYTKNAPVRLNSSIIRFFFFNDTATTEIYTLSLHDALPISAVCLATDVAPGLPLVAGGKSMGGDRKSTRLNSSHSQISYAVFCLKKKEPHWLPYPSARSS